MEPINDISDINSAHEAAVSRWTVGNNAGEGFAPSDEFLAACSRVLVAQNDQQVDVYASDDGTEVAVGDANGPWAVIITPSDS